MDQSTQDLQTTIRPRLLVVAARHGLAQYDRARCLARILGLPIGRALPPHGTAQNMLAQREAEMDYARRHHDAAWHAADHVLVMTALLFEARANGANRTEPIA